MRISSLQMFNLANKSMSDANQAIQKTQEQMSTGKSVLSPADDPVASTKILQLTDDLSSIQQYLKNIDIAQNNLELEESILGNVNNIIQRMQELAVSAGNTATLTDSEYRAMANEVGTRLEELANLMNSQNANGDYIFGGYKSTQAPFSGNEFEGYQYAGDQGQQYIKIADNTKIASTDSGKALFMDVASANKTFATSANPANQSTPPAQISIGNVVDSEEYEGFYPEDIVISFNSDSNIVPPGKNFTATERSTGRVIAANQPYQSGEEIVLNGVSFRIAGSPASGAAAVPGQQLFGSEFASAFPVNFTPPASQSFNVTVGGRTERLTLDGNITNANDLALVLNDPANGNAAKLANLGVTVDNQGFHMPQGVNIRIANGSPNINTVLGLDSVNGTTSSNGSVARKGDTFFVESSEKQGLLNTLARFKNAMENFDGSAQSKEMLSEVVASTLDNLSNAQTSVLDVQAKIGGRINTLDSTRDLHLDSEVINKAMLSDLQDLDYAEAATRLSQQSLILQAAQQSFIRVSQLNLFSRL